MASAMKKRQDEMNLKILRELISLDHNRKCLECGQRGITYADMTTAGFVCVQCSGYLRGINPPHRVKSISMTSFSEREIEQLKEGGNDVARKMWMGNWNPVKNREPDKKDEHAFKEFLVQKYERKQWYKSLSEVKREEESASSAQVEKPEQTKIQPPPSSRTPQMSSERPHATTAAPIIQACTAPTNPTPSAVVATPTTGSTQPKMDLLGDLGGDPFAAKKPVGAVQVMAGFGGAPLIPSNGPAKQQEEFGAFASASSDVGASLSSTSLTLQPSSSSTSGGGDKYAELANLDSSLRGLRVKDEPSPLLPRADPIQSQTGQPFGGGSGFGGGGATGSTNPFSNPGQSGSPAGGMPGSSQASNPFVAAGQLQGVQSGPPGVVMGGQGQFGGGVGRGFPQQQPTGGQMQGFGSGGPQMQQQQQRFPGPQQVGSGGGFGQPAQFVAQPQQWGGGGSGGMPQQQQPQGFAGQQQQMGMNPQMQQWGGGLQQQAQPVGGVPQQQWGVQMQPQGQQFAGGMQQQGPGGFGGPMTQQQQVPRAGGFGAVPQQQMQGQQFGGFVSAGQPGMQPQQQQQQQQQQKPTNQFDWSTVNVGGKQQQNQTGQFSWSSAAQVQAQQPQAQLQQKKYINWGGGAVRLDNSPSSASSSGFSSSSANTAQSASTSTSSGGGGGGWSSGLTKPVASSWDSQQQTQASSMGWSSSVVSGGNTSSNFIQQQQQQQQQPQQTGFGGGLGQQPGVQQLSMFGMGGNLQNQSGGANPFASMSTAQSGPTNPFL